MKLLYIHDNNVDANSANVVQVLNMCNAFAKTGMEVVLAIPESLNRNNKPHDVAEKQLHEKLQFKVVTYRKYVIASRLNMIGSYIGVKRILKTNNADICFVRNPLILRLAVKAGIPTIYETHSKYLHEGSSLLDRIWKNKLRRTAKCDKVLKIVTISQSLYDFWQSNGIEADKLLALHDGFNPGIFNNHMNQEQCRRELDLPQNRKLVVYTGSLSADRGIGRILQMAKRFSDVLFIVVGGTGEQVEYYARSSENEGLENIMWVGHVLHSEIPKYLRAADVLLMLWTSMVKTIDVCSPMKLFEYIASEKIVVGEGFKTIKEVLENGVTALLAEPGMYRELEDKMDRAISNQYDTEIPSRAYKLAVENYSWEKRALSIIAELPQSKTLKKQEIVE